MIRLAFSLIFLAWCAFASAQNPARSGTDHAVFFYVTDFQSGWGNLPETKTETEAIAQKLKDDYGFSVEFVRNPKKADIRAKILELNSRHFKEKDQLLLFFSMHGHYINSADRGYLIPADGKTPANDPLGDTWLSYDDLGAWVSLNPCKHVLLSLDACYSGSFGIRQNATERTKSYPGAVKADASQECKSIETEALFTESYLYFTAGGNERAPAQSQFAKAWLRALDDGWQKKVITTNELRYAFGSVRNPAPEGGIFSRKTNGGEFVFLHKAACATAPPIDKAADKAAWNKAKTTNTFDAYRQYISDFPNGEFRPLAEDKIKAFEKAQREENAWEEAKQLNTWEAYDQFLRDYPNSDYKDVAEFNRSKRETLKGSPTASDGKPTDLPGFVFVQGGSFQMGSEDGDSDEKPIHQVTLSDYYIAVNELTFDEYDAYCAATKKEKPSDSGCGRGKRPVINVSWLDAVAYCNWRSEQDGLTKVYTINGDNVTPNWDANGYRLPTEAEWEYAARSRGGDDKWAGTSSESSLSAYGNFCDKNCEYLWKTEGQNDGYQYTAPVGSFSPNSLGLHDMSGNVWEWCWDWKAGYPSTAQTNPTGPSTGSDRVLRGGGWGNSPAGLRCTFRYGNGPHNRNLNLGFRLARAAR